MLAALLCREGHVPRHVGLLVLVLEQQLEHSLCRHREHSTNSLRRQATGGRREVRWYLNGACRHRERARAPISAGECDSAASSDGATAHLGPLWMERLVRLRRASAAVREKSWQGGRAGDTAVP
jgi:hypothetical protein